LDRPTHFPAHPSEDQLEAYALRHLSEAQTAKLEEHLLLCPACQESLARIDEYIALMKAATAQPPAAKRHPPVWTLPRLAAKPAVWVLAAAAVFSAILLWPSHEKPAPVVLASLRSVGAPMAHAPAGRPLDLAILAPDVPADESYRVEIVDAGGKTQWTGPLTEKPGKLSASVPVRLGAGLYWVRIYMGNAELVREFGLRLE
jgi:anti-sigma factor RsiW